MKTIRTPSCYLLIGAAVVVMIAGVYLAFVLSERAWWARHEGIFVLASARRVSTLLEERRRTTGRYPRGSEEAPDLKEATEELVRTCQARGHRVTAIKWGAGATRRGAATGVAVLTVYGAGGAELLVFGSEGRVALSRDLLTSPARDLPSWARELPSGPARSR
jgi:hypothetical protein